ncbi:hypothetical protein FK220_011785 [Flavobacteriaceae bacterium TP-CH-4]|uniref:Uncharacterized protein n=1 Tax=Pelagihabitans pacificus TaxID=2696054 RepID=A0A967AYQ2_9FLAO|nr:hypothetical protein [Pelagihabitans pacificus]NHF60027.1 hypothetical protein [Pelagihabitans pacificus]
MKTKPLSWGGMMILIALSFLPLNSSAQQTLYALKIDRRIRAEAADITRQYQPRLVMGIDQAMLFKTKVAEFLVRRREVSRDETLSPAAKYKLLKRLSSQETMEMADILESYRWDEYRRIKNEIQPIPKPEDAREDLIAVDPRDH